MPTGIKRKIEINQRFGRLILIKKAGIDKWGYSLWLCKCDCGNTVIKAQEYLFRTNQFCSCGCSDRHKERKFKQGQRFGKLVLLKMARVNKWGPLWHCKCDCGKEIIKSKSYFFRKKNPLRSCGCDIKYRDTKKDLTGQRFHKLTVLKLDRTNSNNRHFWLCKCDCGNERIVAGGHLYTGHTKSCGCYGDKLRDARKLLPGESGFNRLKRNYIRGARDRNFKFELSTEEFRNLVTGNCYYCGAKPANEMKDESEHSKFIYNGIDRIDNSKGYEKYNSVSCCEKCNRMKNILGKAEFIKQCILISKYQIDPPF